MTALTLLTLPAELIVEIFKHCDSRKDVRRLGNTCQHLRRVVHFHQKAISEHLLECDLIAYEEAAALVHLRGFDCMSPGDQLQIYRKRAKKPMSILIGTAFGLGSEYHILCPRLTSRQQRMHENARAAVFAEQMFIESWKKKANHFRKTQKRITLPQLILNFENHWPIREPLLLTATEKARFHGAFYRIWTVTLLLTNFKPDQETNHTIEQHMDQPLPELWSMYEMLCTLELTGRRGTTFWDNTLRCVSAKIKFVLKPTHCTCEGLHIHPPGLDWAQPRFTGIFFDCNYPNAGDKIMDCFRTTCINYSRSCIELKVVE